MGVRPPRIGVGHRATGRTSLAPFIRADGRAPARWQTRVELAWDEERFSVHFHCSDDDAWGTYTERDAPLWQQEVVELFLAAGEAVPDAVLRVRGQPGEACCSTRSSPIRTATASA